jgi:hypothetical protein
VRRVVYLLVVLATLFGALPFCLVRWAEGVAGESGCGDRRPPTKRFFRAMRVLDVGGYFPFFRASADDTVWYHAARCTATFSIRCNEIRNDALKRGREEISQSIDREQRHLMTLEQVERSMRREWEAQDSLEQAATWMRYVDAGERRRVCAAWRPVAGWMAMEVNTVRKLCPICERELLRR